jgi:plastocyanin
MIQNATYSHKFTVAGTYQYVCTYHPWMHGTVVVTG